MNSFHPSAHRNEIDHVEGSESFLGCRVGGNSVFPSSVYGLVLASRRLSGAGVLVLRERPHRSSISHQVMF